MLDHILQQQPTWRYCRVRLGEKKPYPSGWQNTPLTLAQVDSSNIGLLLGPIGQGVCAIDFDGPSAWLWARKNNITELPLTPTWTSGRDSRCQMAFYVPEEYWDVLQTKKISTGPGEGFEFRWAGGQSVVPPSIHPVTHRPYEWIVDATHPMAAVPDNVLMAWLEQLIDKEEVLEDTTPEINVEDLTDKDIEEAHYVLSKVKERYPTLGYDDWMKAAFATAHKFGRSVAEILMKTYYPEQKRNEYRDLYKSWNKGRSLKWGTVIMMAGLKKEQKPVIDPLEGKRLLSFKEFIIKKAKK